MATAIDLGHRPSFWVGAAEIRPATLEIVGPGGRETVEPRVMQVLVALADARGETVTRDDLTMLCWGGRVVGDDSINRVIQRIRRLAEGPASGGFTVKTIHKVGYRLCENGGEATAAVPSVPEATRLSRQKRYALSFVLVLLIGALVAVGLGWPGRGSADEPASLAVLPFRNLSSGDGYFAEGVAEEIRGQLAREPQLRVAGRTSSAQFGNAGDLRAVGKKLDVAHLLEGAVRSSGDRVRVNVALVRADDGVRLWSESYDGGLDDIFAIQQRIGESVAGALRRELVGAPDGGPLTTSGDVYSLYLTARGLMRTREDAKVEAAVELLRRAVALDPRFAPAWSSLGSAVKMRWGSRWDRETEAAVDIEATGYVKRALALQPNLAEAHAAMAMIRGFRGPEATFHVRRAVRLAPASAENWQWLGIAEAYAGNHEDVLAAYRRSVAIDPLWRRGFLFAAYRAWDMGYPEEADAYLRRAAVSGGRFEEQLARGMLASFRGDLSVAVVENSAAIETGTREQRIFVRERLSFDLRRLGRFAEARRLERDDRELGDLWRGRLPDAGALRARYAKAATGWEDGRFISGANKLLFKTGRYAELIALNRLMLGSPEVATRHANGTAGYLTDAPLLALAMRAIGQEEEALSFLGRADAVLRRELDGRPPVWLHVLAARIWAVQGRQGDAVAALERAVGLGWLYAGDEVYPELDNDPGFRLLRGRPRFERVRARLDDHVARERRELAEFRI